MHDADNSGEGVRHPAAANPIGPEGDGRNPRGGEGVGGRAEASGLLSRNTQASRLVIADGVRRDQDSGDGRCASVGVLDRGEEAGLVKHSGRGEPTATDAAEGGVGMDRGGGSSGASKVRWRLRRLVCASIWILSLMISSLAARRRVCGRGKAS